MLIHFYLKPRVETVQLLRLLVHINLYKILRRNRFNKYCLRTFSWPNDLT